MNRLVAILSFFWCCGLFAAEVIPPSPSLFFNDYANVVTTVTAEQLNQKLADFERTTSDQVVVAIFPKMESDSSIDDYTLRVARAWKVGQKDKNNGVALFVFVQDHKMFVQVGRGLEGALPDGLCKRIISNEIGPRFKEGNFDAGVTAGVDAILAATRGEYKGAGSTNADRSIIITDDSTEILVFVLVAIFGISLVMVIMIVAARKSMRRGSWFYYGNGGGWYGDSSGLGGGYSSSGSGGFSSGGDSGGFSGGGGDFGGGGAGGSW